MHVNSSRLEDKEISTIDEHYIFPIYLPSIINVYITAEIRSIFETCDIPYEVNNNRKQINRNIMKIPCEI